MPARFMASRSSVRLYIELERPGRVQVTLGRTCSIFGLAEARARTDAEDPWTASCKGLDEVS